MGLGIAGRRDPRFGRRVEMSGAPGFDIGTSTPNKEHHRARRGVPVMQNNKFEVTARSFNPMSVPGLSGKARDAVNAAFDAMSTWRDRKSTRLNSSHLGISYAVFCL